MRTNLWRHTLGVAYIPFITSKLLHYWYYSQIIFSLLLMLLTASMLLVHYVYTIHIYIYMCVCVRVCACYILLLKRQLNPLFWMAKNACLIGKKHIFDSWTKVLHWKTPVLMLEHVRLVSPCYLHQNLDISPRHTGPLFVARSSALAIAASVSATNCGACAWAMIKPDEFYNDHKTG